MTEIHRPRLGPAGEPCRSCGAALAEDQRYCLQCGTRRAEARLPFLEVLRARAAVAGELAAPVAAAAPRRTSGATWLAGLACLLLALGVGVLIGNAGDGGSSPGPAQVIRVGGAAPAAAAGTAPGTAAGAAAAGAAATGAAAKTRAKAKATRSAAAAKPAAKATNKALQSLQNASPQQYQKKAAKLPKTVGTGGKAPPKDNKPAAGGGSFQEIG